MGNSREDWVRSGRSGGHGTAPQPDSSPTLGRYLLSYYALSISYPHLILKSHLSCIQPEKMFLEPPNFLGCILLYLPPRSLLCAQRVCHTFEAEIKSSPRLQQALFLTPEFSTAQSTIWEQNPLLCDTFPPFFSLQPRIWSTSNRNWLPTWPVKDRKNAVNRLA